MPPRSTRIEARLMALAHEQLVELASAHYHVSDEGARIAEMHLAKHLPPLAAWAQSQVLLSPDLLPSLFLTLGAADVAAAQTCKAWRECWKATLVPRRIVHPAPPLPPTNVDELILDMLALDDERLALDCDDGRADGRTNLVILDRRMQRLPDLPTVPGAAFFAVSVDSLFATDGESIRRYDRGTLALLAENVDAHADEIVGAGGLLFGAGEKHLKAYDATTLEVRFAFGAGIFERNPFGLAVHGNELYACEMGKHRIQVFSLTGQHVRTIRGEFWAPWQLCFVTDRMYLLEAGWTSLEQTANCPAAAHAKLQRRLLVLTPEGDTLQVYEGEPHEKIDGVTPFDGKLFLRAYDPTACSGRLVALQGV